MDALPAVGMEATPVSLAAHAVSRTQDKLPAQGSHLAARRGKKHTAMAVAHAILVIAFPAVAGAEYRSREGDCFDRRYNAQLQRNLFKSLEVLDHSVIFESVVG